MNKLTAGFVRTMLEGFTLLALDAEREGRKNDATYYEGARDALKAVATWMALDGREEEQA